MKDLFGEARADAVARKLPTRPIRGRWANVTGAERDVLKIGSDQFPQAFRRAFGVHDCHEDAAAPAGDHAVDLAQLDEDEESYTRRVGRWSREAGEGISKPEWWQTLVVVHAIRQPVDHLRNWFQKPAVVSEPPKVCSLVWDKAHEISREWERLMDDGEFDAVWLSAIDLEAQE